MTAVWIALSSSLVGCRGEPEPGHPPGGPPAAAGDCFDGARDGDESDVDCGGSCDASCGLGASCDTDADCLFGSCEGSSCVAPTDGPAPTGPVTATVSPEGGTVAIVTDERVAVTLDFPAGAVVRPLEVTLTARTPEQGLAAIELGPAGAVFDQPVTVTMVLPPGVDPGPDAMIGASPLTAPPDELPMLAATAIAGSTLTAELRTFGVPGVDDTGLRAASADYWTRLELNARFYPPEDLVPALELLLTGLLAEYRYEDAVHVQGVLQSVLARRGEPRFEPLIADLIARRSGAVCDALEGAITDLELVVPECYADLKPRMEPVLTWAATGQLLGLTDCDVLNDTGDDHFYLTALEGKTQDLSDLIEADESGVACCECEHDPRPAIAGTCAELGCGGARAAPQDGGAVEILVDTVGHTYEDARAAGALGLDAASGALRTGMAEPSRLAMRVPTWEWCLDRDSRQIAGLLAHAPGDADHVADAQSCGSHLGVEVQDADGAAIDSAALGPTDTPDAPSTSASVSVAEGGTLTLTGPVHALHCDDGAPEQDELVVKVVGDVTAEVDRRPADAAGLLLDADGATYDVDALVSAAGLDPATDREITVELWRESPGCDGLYGDAPSERLFEVGTTDSGWSVVAGGPGTWLGDQTFSYLAATPLPAALAWGTSTYDIRFASPNQVVASVDAPDTNTYGHVALQITLSRPGTIEIAVETVGILSVFVSTDAAAADPGIFADAPNIFDSGSGYETLACDGDHYCSGGVELPVTSFPVEAGTGVLFVEETLVAGASGTATITFTPDP